MKKLIMSVMAVFLALGLCVPAAGCDINMDELEKAFKKVVDDAVGLVIEEAVNNALPEGFKMDVETIADDSEQGQKIKSLIERFVYDKTMPVSIYDIAVKNKDGVKIQPDGKVQISIPVGNPAIRDWTVFHQIDESTAEELGVGFADGMVSFETDALSVFVLAHKSSDMKVNKLELDAHEAGFAYDDAGALAGKTVISVGCENPPRPEAVLVSGVSEYGEANGLLEELLAGVDFRIDKGGYNPEVPGEYTITYIYKPHEEIKATLVVEVQ